MTDTKLLTILPYVGNPAELIEAIKSWGETTSPLTSELVVVTNTTNKFVVDYANVMLEFSRFFNHKLTWQAVEAETEEDMITQVLLNAPNKFYCVLNKNSRILIKGWDRTALDFATGTGRGFGKIYEGSQAIPDVALNIYYS